MKKRISMILLILIAAASCAAAQTSGTPLVPAMSKFTDPAPAALGTWHYELQSGGAVVGFLDISAATESSLGEVSALYRFSQSAEIFMGATETQRIRTTARMRPNLSLISYEKVTEILAGDTLTSREKIKTTVGALAITTVREDNHGKKTITMKKPGPVCFAFGAAWIALFLDDITKMHYEFTSLAPGAESLLIGRIDSSGAPQKKEPFKVDIALGEESMVFKIVVDQPDTSSSYKKAKVVEFGPPPGDMVFKLVEKKEH